MSAGGRWPAMLLLTSAQALTVLDQTIVGVTLPAMARSLGLPPAGLSWAVNGYLIALGGLSLLGGRLADLLGPRRVLVTGLVALALASLAAAAAPTVELLVVARGLQGASGALVTPAALAMVMVLHDGEPARLRWALAIWGAAAGVGGALGVVLGGVLVEWASWRGAFLVNVPVAVIVVLAAPRWLPGGQRRHLAVDVAGALTVTAGIATALYAIVAAPAAPPARTGALALVSALLVAGFVVLQRRRPAPLVPLAVLRAPGLAAGNVVMALLGAAYLPLWLLLNVYLQGPLGLHGLASGLVLVPMRLVNLGLSVAATPRAIARFGPLPTLLAGLAVIALALALLARAPAGGAFVADALAPSLLAAIGMALAYVPAMMLASRGAAPAELGLASGLVGTSYQLGSALGVAITTTVWVRHGWTPAVLTGAGLAVVAALVAGGARPRPAGRAARRPAARPAPALAPIARAAAQTAR